MRLKKFDLNLLVVLDALLTERSATRAGRVVHLTQPAVSNALTRLRDYFDDQLLTHVGHELVPTALGRSLAGPVHELLVRARATLAAKEPFDAKTAKRKFSIMASDYILTVLIADVARHTHDIAPGVAFDCYPNTHPATAELDEGYIDLLVLPQQFLSPHHEHEVLYEEEFVCAVWSKNRLVSDRVSLEQLMEMRHVATAPAGGRDRGLSTIDQWWVERIGSTRNVAMVVGTFAAAPPFVVGTNRYTIMHRRLARHFSKTYELKLLSLPIDFPHRTIAMQWNRHRMQDAGIIWLRKQMIAAANKSK